MGFHAVGLNAPAAKSAVSNVRVVCDRVLRAGGWSTVVAGVPPIPSAFISLDSRFKGEVFAVSVLMPAMIGGVGWCTW